MSVYVYFLCGVHICLSYLAVVFPPKQQSWSSKAHMDTGWLHVNVISLSELLTERMLKLNILSNLTHTLAIINVLWYHHCYHSYIHKHTLAPSDLHSIIRHKQVLVWGECVCHVQLMMPWWSLAGGVFPSQTLPASCQPNDTRELWIAWWRHHPFIIIQGT